MKNFDDIPISAPSEDRFGFNPFAIAISDCIRRLNNPLGSVVAIYGPWGSGKSSVVNLVRYHLKDDAEDINLFSFPAWMYRTEDALAVGFFKELYAGLSPVLSTETQAAGALRKIGANLVGASSLAGMAMGMIAGSLGEKATTATLDALGGFIGQEESTEELQAQLSDALKSSDQRFLVVIDDLDRLSPEEALVIFRLIKSVGRLPNVMYLLAFDRETTEQAVAHRFPSEGAHYLEKIIQAGFELPDPDQAHLNTMMGSVLDELAVGAPEVDTVEFGNQFHAIVAPELRTPRDVLRLANTLSITITPIKNEIFLPDFVSLETFRVFRPSVYRAIRANKTTILNAGQLGGYDKRDERSAELSEKLLGKEPEADHDRLRDALMRLFPQLQNVFANVTFSGTRDWARQRRACSSEHFDTYFRFSVSPEAIKKEELDYLLDESRTINEIQERLHEALGIIHAKGRTKASYLLDELITHGETIPIPHGELLLSAIFEIADDLFVETDVERGFGIANNSLRLHWLLRAILLDRTTLDVRSSVLTRAMETVPLHWQLDLSRSAWEQHHPTDPDKNPKPEDELLLTEDHALKLRQKSLPLIRFAADTGVILDSPNPARLLFEWDNLTENGSNEVREFTSVTLENDASVAKFAKSFLGKSHSHGVGGAGGSPGDLVYRENDRAQIDGIDRLIDLESFRSRLMELASNKSVDDASKDIMQRFLKAWQARDAGDDW